MKDALEEKALELRREYGRKAGEVAYMRNYEARVCGDPDRALFWGAVGATIAMQLEDERDEREMGRHYYPPSREDDRWR